MYIPHLILFLRINPAMQIIFEYPLEVENSTVDGQLTDDTTSILTLGIEFAKQNTAILPSL